MNDKDRIRRKMRLIDLTKGDKQNWQQHEGGVFVHGDSFRHFIVKAAVFKVLQEAGHDVATEVQFPNGYIADVVDASTFIIYEVETDASGGDIVAKIENFDGFDVIDDVVVLDPHTVVNKSRLRERGAGISMVKTYLQDEVIV